MDINKIIHIVRSLKEDTSIANVIGTSNPGEKALGYNIETGTPPVRKTYAKGGKGSRKWWLQYLRGKKNVR